MSEHHFEVATLGGGCFWCLDAIYRDVQGVDRVVSGYSGGHVANPTYEQVCGKRTGHAEVVQVWYDPAVITYDEILYIFWRIHDPTTLNRQGNDVGPQYRSVIFYHDDAQKAAAERTRAEAETGRVWPDPIVTEIVPFETFYEAEGYHQDYFNNNPSQPYCVYVVDPKVRKFRKSFQDKLKETV
jgi:peptide-methionine (S)-S-oxide reductase